MKPEEQRALMQAERAFVLDCLRKTKNLIKSGDKSLYKAVEKTRHVKKKS